jgi:hypothetical protein
MKRLAKYISSALAVLVLTSSVGISITSHICLAGKISSCEEDDNCCRDLHESGFKETDCCKVKSVYVKATYTSAGEDHTLKFFTNDGENNPQIVFSSVNETDKIEKRCHAPPFLKSNRVILLSTSKLSV